jgi:DNA-binding SARP family transcriptional activator
MSRVNVRLFGRLSIEVDEHPATGLEAGKAQELFCYLLLHRQRAHRREELACLLWGETSEPQARKYLRQTLWQLQSALDPRGDHDASRLLLVDADWVSVNPCAELSVDATVFDSAIDAVEGIEGGALDPGRAGALAAAADLYAGDLLEGWYQDWCLFERERLQGRYLGLLDKLMAHCAATGHYEVGLEYGARILRHDRASERAHRQLMRLHYLAGDRTAALRQYQTCLTVLDQELGVRPSRRSTALYEQIRADMVDAPSITTPLGAVATPEPSPPMPLLLHRLRQLRVTLLEIEQQVERDVLNAGLAIEKPSGR